MFFFNITVKAFFNWRLFFLFEAGGPMAPSVWERLRETDSIPDFSVIPASLQPIVQVSITFSISNIYRRIVYRRKIAKTGLIVIII